MHLQHPFVRQHFLLHRVPDPGRLVVLCVVGIHPDAGQNDARLMVDLHFHPPGQLIHLFHRHRIRQLQMNGAVILVRPVIMQKEVVRAAHLRLLVQDPLDFLAQIFIRPPAQDIAQRIAQHFDTGLDDKPGNHHADPGFQRDPRRQENQRRCQHRAAQDGVKQRVRSGSGQRAGMGFFALFLYVPAEQQLGSDGHRQDNQGHRAVVRCLRRDDLLDGFDQGCHAGVQHDERHRQRRQVLNPPVPQGMLPVRASPRQLRSRDGDHGTQRVAQVVYRVQHHRDGVGNQSDGCLECRQKDVGDNPDDARPNDNLIPVLM